MKLDRKLLEHVQQQSDVVLGNVYPAKGGKRTENTAFWVVVACSATGAHCLGFNNSGEPVSTTTYLKGALRERPLIGRVDMNAVVLHQSFVAGEELVSSGAKQATPHALLINELLDSNVPKTEREHAAAREIESLRTALVTAQRREWVGLTDEEFDWIKSVNRGARAFIKNTEAKLKEKNT